MVKAVVTGGAGFIGSHIVERLLAEDFRVIVVDSLAPENAQNLVRLRQHKQMEYVQGTVEDFSFLERLFHGVDYVFHHAAVPLTDDVMDNSISYYERNSKGILNLLQTAKSNGVKKVICASSSAIYGNEPTVPKRESMMPKPLSPYAVSKLVAELYCSIFLRNYGLQTVCLRYFNVYGPRQRPGSPGSVVPKFIQKVVLGEPLIIFGDGNQTRDFVFVEDIAAANLLAAATDATGVFNVGTGKETTMNQLAQNILNLMNRPYVTTIHEKEVIGEIKYSVAKINALGYRPRYFLDKGLKETIEYILPNNFQ
jgi:UDP-glucose 4-epimerase